MKNIGTLFSIILAFLLGYFARSWVPQKKTTADAEDATSENTSEGTSSDLDLGAFSVSLNVKDLAKSKAYYETLGFSQMGGGEEMNYYIMKNGQSNIGIFYGMFEGNILTYNPGWNENAENLESFTDVRDIQKQLKANNISLILEASDSTTGPGSIMLQDPDSNMILIDQHR